MGQDPRYPRFKYGYKYKTDLPSSSSYHFFAFIHNSQLNQVAQTHTASTPTHPHTHTHYIPHHLVIFPPPQGAINKGKSKFVHPVLPSFLQPLTLSRHVRPSPRMWKPILACHLHTVIHIINRKSSCWFPRDLHASGELLHARPFLTNEARTFSKRAYLDGCMS